MERPVALVRRLQYEWARQSARDGRRRTQLDVLRGDAFVAKLWDDQEGFVRHDFTLADCASDAAWVVEAQARNANRTDPQAAMARLQPGGDLGGGAAAGPAQPELAYEERLEQAAAARAAGTDAFKAGDVDAAAEKYAAALALWTPMPPPLRFSDGAATKASVGQWTPATQQCAQSARSPLPPCRSSVC